MRQIGLHHIKKMTTITNSLNKKVSVPNYTLYLSEDTAMVLRRQTHALKIVCLFTLNFECRDNFPVNLGGRILAVVHTSLTCFLVRSGCCIAVRHQGDVMSL
jgi:hypothetical protein